jgi:hypothetical protein
MMRWIVLLLAVNCCTGALLLHHGSVRHQVPVRQSETVHRLRFPGGAEAVRENGLWFFVHPFRWPGQAHLLDAAAGTARRSADGWSAAGEWTDFLDRHPLRGNPEDFDCIQLRTNELAILLKKVDGAWHLYPEGALEMTVLKKLLNLLRAMEFSLPTAVAMAIPPDGEPAAILTVDSPLVNWRQRLQWFRGNGGDLLWVNETHQFSIGSGWLSQLLPLAEQLYSRKIFPGGAAERIIWERDGGTIVLERDGDTWVRLAGDGAVESFGGRAAALVDALANLEWQTMAGDPLPAAGTLPTLTVDGRRLRIIAADTVTLYDGGTGTSYAVPVADWERLLALITGLAAKPAEQAGGQEQNDRPADEDASDAPHLGPGEIEPKFLGERRRGRAVNFQ